MSNSFNKWWYMNYAGKNTHLMITREIAKSAYNEGRKQGRKLEKTKYTKLLSDIEFINSIVDSLNTK